MNFGLHSLILSFIPFLVSIDVRGAIYGCHCRHDDLRRALGPDQGIMRTDEDSTPIQGFQIWT